MLFDRHSAAVPSTVRTALSRATAWRAVVAVVALGVAGGPGRAAPIPRDTKADAARAAAGRLADRLKKATPPAPPGDGEFAIYMADLVAGGVTLIASAADKEWPQTYCGSPSWSRDGERIYYDATPGHGQWTQTRTQVIGLSGQGVDRVVLGPGNCPAPSPDGKRVAVLVNGGAKPGLSIMSAFGGRSQDVGVYGIPRWSPGGRDLIVAAFANPTPLHLVDTDDGSSRSVELSGYTFHSTPNWADERTLVAVVRSDKGTSVALVDVKEPGEAKVAETLWRRGEGLPEEIDPAAPVYSPLARRGVFVGREPKGKRLYVFEPGKAPKPLEPNREPSKVSSPSLSPDGRYLLFADGKRN